MITLKMFESMLVMNRLKKVLLFYSECCLHCIIGTANPAVIYLEGLVAHQQPTYIPASNIHQPIGVYPHTYSINPHHPYAHQAPDGSIQVYSTDISSHPGYIAYQ
jgi:hypothetical protein